MGIPKSDWKLFVAVAVGMGLLLFFGISIVIFNWGEGSVVVKYVPSEPAREYSPGFCLVQWDTLATGS